MSLTRLSLFPYASKLANACRSVHGAYSRRVIEGLRRSEDLATFPNRVRPGRCYPRTRELVVRPYLVIFRVHTQEVEIVAVVDGRRGNIAEIIVDRLADE